jgi:hypothetical protein
VDGAQQYLRAFSLVVFGSDLDGLDLSELRCKFVVKRSDTMTPNVADNRAPYPEGVQAGHPAGRIRGQLWRDLPGEHQASYPRP